MSDYIDRQAAICAIEEYADRLQMVNWKENPGVPYKAHALNWVINTLRDLPSAEVEPVKHGRLIDADELRFEIEKYFNGLPIQGHYDMLKLVNEAPTIIEAEEGEKDERPY